ncbi:hypothetical protein [Vulcanisaeta sp. JCM 14467]|uniref:hypothetical protein n=1 Tax=Vulcanisaeta sp. JCM 14467 TaxID=1295370 RepID=UPI0006D0DB1E|nr:hypothetical protein [Vulcanisaeta sp. JCM 14467]
MKFLEELMNILFQEYGSLILTVISVILSITMTAFYAELLRNNIELIKELNAIIQWINTVIR